MTIYKVIATFNHYNPSGKLKEYVISDYEIIIDNLNTAKAIYETYINTFKKFIEILRSKNYNINIKNQAKFYTMKAPLLKRQLSDSIHFEVSCFEPMILHDGRISSYPKNNLSFSKWNYVYIEEPKKDGRNTKETPTI